VVSSNAHPGSGKPIASASLIGGLSKKFLKRMNNPVFHFVIGSQRSPTARSLGERHAAAPATLRTANDNITRVTPLIIMLTPTNVPIAHTELDGHCR